jgi:hypothetical protein
MLADGMLRYPSEANRRLDALLRRAHDSAAGTAPAGSIGWPLLLQIWIRTLLDRSEHPAAELRNIDGESLVYARAEFELASRDPGAVAHHLDAMPGWAREQFDELKWTRSEMRARSGASESDDDSEFVRTVLANARIAAGKLTVDANSRERMRRVLAELTSTLRGLVRPPTVTEEEAR